MNSIKVSSGVNSEIDTITLEILERYRSANPRLSGNELYELIESENSEDGDSPIWSGEAFEALNFERRLDPDYDYDEEKAEFEEWWEYYKEASARNAAKSRCGLSAFVLGNPTLTHVALEISRCCNVPEELAICAILSAISAGLGKGLSIEYKFDGTTPLGLYIIGFMNSGEGKTATANRALKPLYDKQAELRERWNAESSHVKANIIVNDARIKKLTKTAEGKSLDAKEAAELAERMKTADNLKKELIPPSVLMGDFTFEAQRNVLNGNREQISMISDDAGRAFQNLLGLNNKLQMPEDSLMLNGYSGTDFMSDRAAAGNVFIPKVWCSLFWLAQPDKIELLTKNTWIVEGGFLARCLPTRFNGEAHVQSDEDVSPALMKEYDKQWNEIFAAYREEYVQYQTQKTIKVSPDAREGLKKIEVQIVTLQNAAPPSMKAFAARWMENLWRLVGVLHAARHLGNAHNVPLSAETASDGVDILNYFMGQQEKLLREDTAEEKSASQYPKFVEAFEKGNREPISLRDLKRNSNIDESTVREWTEQLNTQAGWCKFEITAVKNKNATFTKYFHGQRKRPK